MAAILPSMWEFSCFDRTFLIEAERLRSSELNLALAWETIDGLGNVKAESL